MGTFSFSIPSKRSMKALALVLVLAAAVVAGCGQTQSQGDSTQGRAHAEPLPDVALVECTVNGARVRTPTVRPQPDGVHLRITNDTGSELAFSADDAEHGGQGASAPSGSVSYVWALPPGKLSVKCTNDQADPSEIEGTELTVVDEEGLWVSTSLYPGCHEASTGTADYGVGAKGEGEDPVAIARKAFGNQGLKAGDVVERAGYPEGDETIVRVVRSGDVIATMSFLSDGAGGWLPENTTRCEKPPVFD